MNDDIALYRERREASREKRAANRQKSAEVLRQAGVQFVSKNNGAHLIVAGEWDCWPGTGLYRHRTLPMEGRGVRNLLHEIKKQQSGGVKC